MGTTKHHTVSVYSKRGYLYLRWRFQGKQHQLACLLPDTPINRTIAESRAKTIELDIATGSYDTTLAKYKSIKSPIIPIPNPEDIRHYDADLSPLSVAIYHWLESNKQNWKLNSYLKHQSLIKIAFKHSKELNKPLKSFVVSAFVSDIQKASKQVREVLKTLSACFNWLIAHDLVDVNPFSKVLKTLPKDEWETNPKANAFTPENKQRLIDYFRNRHPKYLPFIQFLFLTGCRPSEAVGLEWSQVHLEEGKTLITFDRSISYRNGMAIFNKGSKNNKSRKFPCNQELTELLCVLHQSRDDDGLVFGSGSKPLNYPNFVKRQWKDAMLNLELTHTPYNCRDTFLTEQIKSNKPLAIICLWCDTSVEMIQRHYLDKQSALEIVPN